MLCDRAAWWLCQTHAMPCHAVLALPALAGEKEDGALGIRGGSPARCAPTLTAGSKTVTPDLFSLQLNLNPDYNQGEPPLLSPSPCGRSSVTSGLNAEPKPSQGMGELTLPGIGAAGDGVTTVPVPRPGTESTAIALVASLPGETLLDFHQNPWGMCHRYPCLCHGWYPAPKLHPWSGGGLVAAGCTHCPLPAHLATPKLNKLIKPELCVCAIKAPGWTHSAVSWERALWMETALTDWGSLQIPFPAQLAIKQLQRTSRLTSWGL